MAKKKAKDTAPKAQPEVEEPKIQMILATYLLANGEVITGLETFGTARNMPKGLASVILTGMAEQTRETVKKWFTMETLTASAQESTNNSSGVQPDKC